jgi:hypothetical protein
MKELLTKIITPPYKAADFAGLFIALFLLLTIPLTVIALQAKFQSAEASRTPCTITAAEDKINPSVRFIQPEDGEHLSGGDTLIRVEAMDNFCVRSVSIFMDGRLIKILNNSPFDYSLDLRRISVGTHSLVVVASDYAGNSSSQAISVFRGIKEISPK